MKNKIWFCVFPLTVLVAAAFIARQRTLNEVRAGNESLRQQINAQRSVPMAEPPPAVQSTNPVVALNLDEHTELLRLRGKIQPLRRGLQEMSNRVVTLAQPAIQRASTQTKQLPPPQPSDRNAEIQVMNTFMRSEPYRNARDFNIALGDYLKAHSGEIPDDLVKVETSSRSSLPQGVSERFELIQSGKIPEEALSYTLVAREKEPQQLTDGRWIRIYLRADGGTTTATLRSASKSDWKAWERSNEAFMKKQAQQTKSAP